jgi:hypothetical protein
MVKVKSLHDLKRAPKDEPVYVETISRLYRNIDGEWVEKLYFSTREISEITSVSVRQVQAIIRKLNLRSKYMSGKAMDYQQLKIIAQAVKMRMRGIDYKSIKKEFNL